MKKKPNLITTFLVSGGFAMVVFGLIIFIATLITNKINTVESAVVHMDIVISLTLFVIGLILVGVGIQRHRS